MRLLLLVCAVAVSGCSSPPAEVDEVARDAAEHQALVAEMERHPALAERQAEATGKPLELDPKVRPRPPGVEPAPHPHAPAEPHRH